MTVHDWAQLSIWLVHLCLRVIHMNDMSSILPIKQNSIFIYFASHCGSSEEKLKEHFKSTSLAYFVASLLYETTFLKQSESVCACVIIRKKSEIKCTYKVANYWHVLVSLKKIDLIQNKSWLHSWDSTFGSITHLCKCKAMKHSIR